MTEFVYSNEANMKKHRKTIALQPTDYQPSKAEQEKKVRIKTTPENLAKAIFRT